jgi:hydrogenase-1 operon protein HyaF
MNSILVNAILQELSWKLTDLATAGRNSMIDLRRLPLTPPEYDQLKELLGRGELAIELNALGVSNIVETRFSGVWWVTHMNAAGDKVGDVLEVALVPELVGATTSEVATAAEALSGILLDTSTSVADSADPR